jgi:hypothetical protein
MIYAWFALGFAALAFAILVDRVARLEKDNAELRRMVNGRFDSYSYRVSNLERIRAYDAETCRWN